MNFGSYGSFMVTVAGMVIGIMLASQKTFLGDSQPCIAIFFQRKNLKHNYAKETT